MGQGLGLGLIEGLVLILGLGHDVVFLQRRDQPGQAHERYPPDSRQTPIAYHFCSSTVPRFTDKMGSTTTVPILLLEI